ncbi:hypothetical protein LCGC14_0728350 [marine sediment metagenome]|uniref:Uncharacterized protein n=1 Tax=marine sediment metagenome TaxID=412755 RepID=A0A0F9QAG2_9ZZZZ
MQWRIVDGIHYYGCCGKREGELHSEYCEEERVRREKKEQLPVMNKEYIPPGDYKEVLSKSKQMDERMIVAGGMIDQLKERINRQTAEKKAAAQAMMDAMVAVEPVRKWRRLLRIEDITAESWAELKNSPPEWFVFSSPKDPCYGCMLKDEKGTPESTCRDCGNSEARASWQADPQVVKEDAFTGFRMAYPHPGIVKELKEEWRDVMAEAPVIPPDGLKLFEDLGYHRSIEDVEERIEAIIDEGTLTPLTDEDRELKRQPWVEDPMDYKQRYIEVD